MYPTLLILFVSLESIFSHKCDSFDNVQMTVYPRGGESYQSNITGCIERVAFQETILRVEVEGQTIPRLGVDSVKTMKYLHTVVFNNCSIKVVDAGAFRNLPNIRTIKITRGGLEVVSSGVFANLPNLEVVKLFYNNITKIENGAFVNIPTLKKLHCDYNELREWKTEWFINTTNLDQLVFKHNKIKFLPRRAFYHLPKLKEIDFDYNEIETIESEAFKGLTGLSYLGLRYNRLKTINPNVFPNHITIRSMAIDANYLNFISKKLMLTVLVMDLSVGGNPWKCPCWNEILLWLYETPGTFTKNEKCVRDDLPVCYVPDSSRTCTEVVDDDATRNYLNSLRKMYPPLYKYCARLD